MPEAIRFYFDPLCPWCYQTSRWARHLEQTGEISIDWAVFSLAIANRGDEGRAAPDSGSAPALRVAIALRDQHGGAAVGDFVAALCAAVHVRGEAVDEPAVIATALREAGADPDVAVRALQDPSTWDAVQAEHDDAVAKHRMFGVPTIVFDAGRGPAMFGPIIVEPPSAAAAGELWTHFSWMVRNPNFAEVKRERSSWPDLESVRAYARRAER